MFRYFSNGIVRASASSPLAARITRVLAFARCVTSKKKNNVFVSHSLIHSFTHQLLQGIRRDPAARRHEEVHAHWTRRRRWTIDERDAGRRRRDDRCDKNYFFHTRASFSSAASSRRRRRRRIDPSRRPRIDDDVTRLAPRRHPSRDASGASTRRRPMHREHTKKTTSHAAYLGTARRRRGANARGRRRNLRRHHRDLDAIRRRVSDARATRAGDVIEGVGGWCPWYSWTI